MELKFPPLNEPNPLQRISPSTCNLDCGASVPIPTFLLSFITNTLPFSSLNLTISLFPLCVTTKAGPVPAFTISNWSVY